MKHASGARCPTGAEFAFGTKCAALGVQSWDCPTHRPNPRCEALYVGKGVVRTTRVVASSACNLVLAPDVDDERRVALPRFP